MLVAVCDIINNCVPNNKQFKVEYIKNVTYSNEPKDFHPFDNTNRTGQSYYTISDGWQMISIEIKAEYLPANSGLFLFECSGIIVYYYQFRTLPNCSSIKRINGRRARDCI